MNYKRIYYLTLILFVLMFSNCANASKLPNDVWQFVSKQLPTAQERFDSVVVLQKDVMYIPLYPPATTNVDEIKIEYSYPSGNLSSLPEVVLLNNGYSFLKVVKDSEGNYTLTKKDDLPLKVRLGLMPQDMLIPVGLKMPESLRLTLGDLLIPSKEEKSLNYTSNDIEEKTKTNYNTTIAKNEFIPTTDFKDKKIYINPKNSKFLEVYDNTSRNSLYELKLSSMPLKIAVSSKNNIAVVLYWSGKQVELVDLKDENSVAKIDIDANANDVVLDEKNNIAFVSSQRANAIYCIDLNSMQLVKVIKLDQKPSKLTYNDIDGSIAFYDEFLGKVFNITTNRDEFVVQPMGSVENVSRILSDIANIYAISRTTNEIYIFDKALSTLLKVVDVDKKPVDAILIGNKIYILCSKEGYIDVYDIVNQKIISRTQLANDGFYAKLTLIPDSSNIMISGVNSKKYLIYDTETMKLTKSQNLYVDISNILILDKNQRL